MIHQLNAAFAVIGGLVLLLGFFSSLVKNRSPISEPLIALFLGVLLGPEVFGIFGDALDDPAFLEEASRITLAAAVMGIALRLPRGYVFRNWKPFTLLLAGGMPLMWLSSSLIAYLVVGLPVWIALLLGATVTPTDPVVASSTVNGQSAEKNIPTPLRHLLSAESGANDGLTLPFVLLPLLYLGASPGQTLGNWLLLTLLWKVLGAALLGGIVGYFASRLLRVAKGRQLGERNPLLATTLALALMVLGGIRLLGGSALLAIFAAGVMFDAPTESRLGEVLEHIQEAVARFFILPIFVLFGMVLPWQQWGTLGWAGIAFVVAVLLLRRLPALLAMHAKIGPLRQLPDALFAGWFGPIGVSTIFYISLARQRTHLDSVWALGSLLVFASVVLYGVVATPLVKFYGRFCRERSKTGGGG